MKTKNAVKRSPIIEFTVTKDSYDGAVRSSSGGCLAADQIKKEHPQFTNVEVGTQTIRVTDKARGERYVYLTPRAVGEMLLYFDQGWTEEELPKKFVLRRAIQILPIIRNKSDLKAKKERREKRMSELEAKEKSSEPLTDVEKRSLSNLRNRKEPTERPTNYGSAKVEGTGSNIVIRGGTPPVNPRYNPNLLHGRNRIFGAKTAKPSEVFEQAVQQAMKERLEEAAAKAEQGELLAEVTPS